MYVKQINTLFKYILKTCLFDIVWHLLIYRPVTLTDHCHPVATPTQYRQFGGERSSVGLLPVSLRSGIEVVSLATVWCLSAYFSGVGSFEHARKIPPQSRHIVANVHVFHCEKIIIRICEAPFWWGPSGLLSGPPYRRKLLALVLMWAPKYTDSIAKRITHVCLQLNKPILVGPFGPTVWAPVQDKVAGIGIFVNSNVYRFHCKKKYPCMSPAE